MSASKPIAERKPLTDWVPVPRWVLRELAGTDASLEANLKVWAVEGPVLAWPEDLKPRTAEALAYTGPPWCCENGERLSVRVCPKCLAWWNSIPSDRTCRCIEPEWTGEGDGAVRCAKCGRSD